MPSILTPVVICNFLSVIVPAYIERPCSVIHCLFSFHHYIIDLGHRIHHTRLLVAVLTCFGRSVVILSRHEKCILTSRPTSPLPFYRSRLSAGGEVHSPPLSTNPYNNCPGQCLLSKTNGPYFITLCAADEIFASSACIMACWPL